MISCVYYSLRNENKYFSTWLNHGLLTIFIVKSLIIVTHFWGVYKLILNIKFATNVSKEKYFIILRFVYHKLIHLYCILPFIRLLIVSIAHNAGSVRASEYYMKWPLALRERQWPAHSHFFDEPPFGNLCKFDIIWKVLLRQTNIFLNFEKNNN